MRGEVPGTAAGLERSVEAGTGGKEQRTATVATDPPSPGKAAPLTCSQVNSKHSCSSNLLTSELKTQLLL